MVAPGTVAVRLVVNARCESRNVRRHRRPSRGAVGARSAYQRNSRGCFATISQHRGWNVSTRRSYGRKATGVFGTPTGGPINPRTDYTDRKRLLAAAGLHDARLHDARHTAATLLLILGVPERAVMGLMGWSHSAMAGRYQHVTTVIQQDIATGSTA